MSMHRSRRSVLGAAALFATDSSSVRAQQPYPGTQPVTIVLPYTTGGLPTVIADTLTRGLGERLGGTFVADFKPGGSMVIGTRLVARARPDGHTLLMGSVGVFTITPFTVRNPGFDPLADFEPIGMIGNTLFLLVGQPRWPGLKELVAEARRRPRALTYATWGAGTTSHLVTLDFLARAGIEMLHVPFAGTTAAITEILGGRIDVLFSTFASAKPHVEAGRLRGFAVPSAGRAPGLPDVPTFRELGFDVFDYDAWLSLSAPSGTPRPIIERLEQATAEIFAEPATRRRLDDLGLMASPPGGAAMRESIQRNLVSNRQLLTRADMQPE